MFNKQSINKTHVLSSFFELLSNLMTQEIMAIKLSLKDQLKYELDT